MPSRNGQGCCGQDFERVFDAREAERDLRSWREDGLPHSTAELIDALRAAGVEGASLLDIGAGVGMVHLELLAAGALSATDVDASSAYLATAKEEAQRRGFGDRVAHRHGDVVDLAEDLPAADVVTLDRVICCYPDLGALLGAALLPGPRLIGFVHPVDVWWVRTGASVLNGLSWLLRRRDNFYIHRQRAIDGFLGERGFHQLHNGGSRVWRVAVYGRSPA
ncbi:MAG TPA: methyltransferase domain-containing protein [Methylomirabilota bacterium]|nr:methyltransferase domain-containing protein [Methylomirabilota bacterium]